MGGMVAAKEGVEAFDFLQAVNIADGTVIDEAIAGIRPDGVADIVADGGAVYMGAELVADIDITRLQHVHRPGILAAGTTLFLTAGIILVVDVRPARHEGRGDRTADDDHIRVQGHPVAFVLVVKPVTAQYRPGFLQGHQLHALEDVIGYFRAAVSIALAFPGRGQKQQFLPADLLGRDRQRCTHGKNKRQANGPAGDQTRHEVPPVKRRWHGVAVLL